MALNVAFDFDGTLITCENKQKYVLCSIVNSINGIDRISNEKLNFWWELKRNGYSTEKALLESGFSEARQIAAAWIRRIENFEWNNIDRPFRDSQTTLEYLKSEKRFNIIILTGRTNTQSVYQAIYKFGFNKLIDDLIIVNPFKAVEGKKSHLKRIRPLFYVGDSEIDYFAAVESGIRFYGLSRGQRSKQFLKNLGEIHIEENLKFLSEPDFIVNLLEAKDVS